MNLIGLLQYGNKNTQRRNTETVKPQGNGSVSTGSHSRQAVKNLAPGQTIQGEVVGKNGNEVQIKIDNDTIITARLDRDMNVAVGQSMTFEIKNNSGVQVALRPLYENMAQDPNVLRALEAAKLPATGELMRMVSSMMKEGMSIDRNALLDMSKLIMANQGADPETVVMLKGLQLPITPENIEQFGNYQRYEHQILSNVTDILMEIPEIYQSMTSAGQGDAAVDFYTQILQLFTGEQPAGSQEENAVAGNRIFTDIVGGEEGTASSGTGVIEGGNAAQENGNLQAVQMQAEGRMAESLLNLADRENVSEETEAVRTWDGSGMENAAISENEVLLSESLDVGERNQLAVLLGRMGFSEEQIVQIRTGNIEGKELLKDIRLLLAAHGDTVNRADILNLFGSKEYNRVLHKEILEQWLMKPEEVSDKKNVEDFYSRLRNQTARLTETLGQALKDTPLAKSLNNMQNSIDFMNQINQMYNYIQLPLKMSGKDTHGDLYVYTNRKSTMKEDGSVSALLHLDMEYLGTMDIHVLMKDKNVSTKFYLQDESMIDFIADNIHILNERLEKRGYSFQAQMLVNEEENDNRNIMETITAQEKKATLLAQYSFDVRA